MSETQRRLIVNADDLGRTRGINEGIFKAHEKGLVTSATLMVIYPAAEEAAGQLDRYPDLGIGLHVQLSGGAPLLSPESIPSLVDEQGLFPAKPEGLTRIAPDQVRVEVQAQLVRFRELTGRLPTHLDSHHHSHRLREVCEALIDVAHEWKLPVRRSSPEIAEWLRQIRIPTTDVFIEDFFGSEARLEVLLEILTALGPGTSELMCHPGISDEGLRRDSSYADGREDELAVLTHPDAHGALETHDIHLTHFGQL